MIFKHILKIKFLNKPEFVFVLFLFFYIHLNGITKFQTIQFSISRIFCLHTVIGLNTAFCLNTVKDKNS